MNPIFLHKIAWSVVFLSIFILIKSIVETIMNSLKRVEKLEKTNILLKKCNNRTNLKLKNLIKTKQTYKNIIDIQQNNNIKLHDEFENLKLKCNENITNNFMSFESRIIDSFESMNNEIINLSNDIQKDFEEYKNICDENIENKYNKFLINQNTFESEIILRHDENLKELKTYCGGRLSKFEDKIIVHEGKLNIIMFESNLMVRVGNIGEYGEEYLPFLIKILTIGSDCYIRNNINNGYNNASNTNFEKLANFSNFPFLETFILNGDLPNINKCDNLNKYFETMHNLKTVKINLKSDYKSYLDFSKNKKIELLEITDIELNNFLFDLIKTFKHGITINLISCKYSNTELKKRVFQYCENKHTLKII